MNTIQIIYLVLIFATVFVVALVILAQFNTRPLQARLQLLKGEAKGPQDATDEPAWVRDRKSVV